MSFISIFNDVLGPIMRGPSSSHTAGSYHISHLARGLVQGDLESATFIFDANGSYARVYRQQGADLAFAAGLLGRPLADPQFFHCLELAKSAGMDICFRIGNLSNSDHPNTVQLSIKNKRAAHLAITAQSVGGGMIQVTHLQNRPVSLNGKRHELVAIGDPSSFDNIRKYLAIEQADIREIQPSSHPTVLQIALSSPPTNQTMRHIKDSAGIEDIWYIPPLFRVQKGKPLFADAAQMISRAEHEGCSLGEIALAYESSLLGINREEALIEMGKRLQVMEESIITGLDNSKVNMQLLSPSAASIISANEANNLPIGGIHTQAAAKAMAVMHASNSGGVVCAAPTGGSAGTLPGIISAAADKLNLSHKDKTMALFAAGAIGTIIASRATFAAEVAGCQVEIGAATAMGAAATIELTGGTARQAADAAAISLQNTMGSVCDLVQGICEIPCHTRNGIGASSALVCADLVRGGYQNPIPLDETVDAVYSVGKMLPSQLRCTALGGLATTPTAKKMKPPGTFVQAKNN